MEVQKRENGIYNIILFQLCMLFIMPPMDGKMNLPRIILYVIFAVLSVVFVLWGCKSIYRLVNFKFVKQNIYVISFFCLCLVSAIWAYSRNVPFSDIIRGILPFAWYLYIPILTSILMGEQLNRLVTFVGYISCLYSLRILLYYMIYVVGRPNERVTYHLFQATSVLPMVGVLIWGNNWIHKREKERLNLVLSLLCYFTVILTETKSMLLATVGGIVFWGIGTLLIGHLNWGKSREKEKFLIWIACILFLSLILMTCTNLGKRWSNMISISENSLTDGVMGEESHKIEVVDEGSVSVRLIELSTALNKFTESPILGQGIGYRWSAEGIDYGEPVIYMHNIIAFVAMDFGILGELMLLWICVAMCIAVGRGIKKQSWDMILYFSLIGMLFLYSNFFAVYRSIEFTLVATVFFSCFVVKYREVKG